LKENTQKQPRESAIRVEQQERLSKKETLKEGGARDQKRSVLPLLQVLTKYGGRSPHFISKVLGVDEALVVANLKELQKQGKILSSGNRGVLCATSQTTEITESQYAYGNYRNLICIHELNYPTS
jgi:hypothetical protein